jgi:hypothetical protein
MKENDNNVKEQEEKEKELTTSKKSVGEKSRRNKEEIVEIIDYFENWNFNETSQQKNDASYMKKTDCFTVFRIDYQPKQTFSYQDAKRMWLENKKPEENKEKTKK